MAVSNSSYIAQLFGPELVANALKKSMAGHRSDSFQVSVLQSWPR